MKLQIPSSGRSGVCDDRANPEARSRMRMRRSVGPAGSQGHESSLHRILRGQFTLAGFRIDPALITRHANSIFRFDRFERVKQEQVDTVLMISGIINVAIAEQSGFSRGDLECKAKSVPTHLACRCVSRHRQRGSSLGDIGDARTEWLFDRSEFSQVDSDQDHGQDTQDNNV